MKNLSEKDLKLLIVISVSLLISLLIYIHFFLLKDMNDKETTFEKKQGNHSEIPKMLLTAGTTSKLISASKGEEKLREVSGKEIVPKEEALNNDGALDQLKINAHLDNIFKEPRVPIIDKNKFHSTFGRKVVFIYSSHNRESFLPYFKKGTAPEMSYHSKFNVTLVGDRLGNVLKQNGIGNRVSDVDIISILGERDLDFGSSYQLSREIVLNEMKFNPDLEMNFDIHRDSLPGNLSTTTINGNTYAKISFVIGSSHENYEENLKFTNSINDMIEKSYPGLSRGVIIKSSDQGNGVYNQDLSPNSVIIEIGGVENRIDELYRTADLLGNVISEYYWQTVH